MAKHGNSHENDAEHHLYEIRDRRLDDVHKYGICGRPLNKDGTSPRANEQVNYLNRAMRWACFFAKVLVTGIAEGCGQKKWKKNMLDDMRLKQAKDRRGIRRRRNKVRFNPAFKVTQMHNFKSLVDDSRRCAGVFKK